MVHRADIHVGGFVVIALVSMPLLLWTSDCIAYAARIRTIGCFHSSFPSVVKKSAEVGGIESVALTKLDVLDDFDEVKICVGYELDGGVIDYVPSSLAQAVRLRPVYETMEGWKSPTRSARSIAELPMRAVTYIRRIEEFCGVPVAVIGSGPDRDDLIILKNI